MPTGVYLRTAWHLQRLKARPPVWNKGKKTGQKVWNKGKTYKQVAGFAQRQSERMRKAWAEGVFTGMRGKKLTPEQCQFKREKFKGRYTPWLIGRKLSLLTRANMADAHSGSKTNFWKGGITPINKAIRAGLKYALWREAVFRRDNYTCVFCKVRGGRIEADHIKEFAKYPELRFKLSNGRTLCRPCHIDRHKMMSAIKQRLYAQKVDFKGLNNQI